MIDCLCLACFQILFSPFFISARVFEIRNFLSPAEVQHIVDIAETKDMGVSLTGEKLLSTDNNATTPATKLSRTSRNAWILREESPIIDSIYRRAADLLKIDESFLRERFNEETKFVEKTAGEPLQLVKYSEKGEYRARKYNEVCVI